MLIDFASLELAVPIADTALLPPRVKFWIELETSMTRALADANGKLPRINKRSEGEGMLSKWEQAYLNCTAANDAGYIRHILLSNGNVDLMAARSVALKDGTAAKGLAKLGDRPLADLLFDDVGWRRLKPVVALSWGAKQFGRATVWRCGPTPGDQLLVAEFFLEAMLT